MLIILVNVLIDHKYKKTNISLLASLVLVAISCVHVDNLIIQQKHSNNRKKSFYLIPITHL